MLFLPAVAFAQNTVSGRVTDPQGAAVAAATVTLTGTGISPRTAQSGADGTFSVPDVVPGSYVLAVDAAGFQRWTQSIAVGPSGSSPINVVLPIPGFSESVAVSAPRLEEELPQQLQQTGVRVQTITSAQLENGGYYDVGQALQALVPGLFLSPKAGAFDYVTASLQGSRTNEILWLVDGVRISNRLYNGTTPLDTIPAHMIERIEIIEGGQGLFYGTQAVAGAINVVTKAFADTSNGRLDTGVDTNTGRHVNVFARDTLSRNKFVLYGSTDTADGYHSFPSDQYQPSNTDRLRSYDVLTFGGKYAYDFSSALRFSGMYQRSDVTLDNLRPGRSGASQVGGVSAAYNARAEHIASAKLDYTARKDVELFFKGYYHQWDSHWNEIQNEISSPGTQQVISDGEFWGFKDYGANVLARLTPTRNFEYFAGYDFQNYRGRDDVLLIAPNTETVNALFGQVRTTRDLLPKAVLGFGARFNAPTHGENATVWTATGEYDFSGQVFARASVGTAFRYPDAYELFASDPTCCFGNPNLEPEKSTNFNGSVGRRGKLGTVDLQLEAIGFFRRVTNLIVDVDDGSGETTVTANRPDVVKVQGLALVGGVTLSPAVTASLNYTYSHSQKTNELAGGYSALTGIPSHQVQGTLDLHPTGIPVGVTLAVNNVGSMTDTVSGFGSVPSGKYTIADLSGRVFIDSRRRHRINVRLENLFDETYTTIHSRSYTDATATPFIVNNLGVPRTFHVSYSFGF
jgi:vitamin B12 transporter